MIDIPRIYKIELKDSAIPVGNETVTLPRIYKIELKVQLVNDPAILPDLSNLQNRIERYFSIISSRQVSSSTESTK